MLLGDYHEHFAFAVKASQHWAFFPTELPDGRKVWLQHYYEIQYWRPHWFRLDILACNPREAVYNERTSGYWQQQTRVLSLSGTDVYHMESNLRATAARLISALTPPTTPDLTVVPEELQQDQG